MGCFYDLPRPLRERIYRHALVMARVFVRPQISMEYLLDLDQAEVYAIPNLALLQASRKIYHEAMPIYLDENIFSIVQVDLLATARMENPRVAKNLRRIRKVELIFDHRDYLYMARFLGSELPAVMAEVEDWADNSSSKRAGLKELNKLQVDFDLSTLWTGNTNSTTTVTTASTAGHSTKLSRRLWSKKTTKQQQPQHRRLNSDNSKPGHGRHIKNMKEYLWGRTLTFVRQTFQLSHLYIDLRRCTCPLGCCRLADQVLDWGWVHFWIHGMPSEVEVRGSSAREKERIARSLDRQSLRPGLKVEDVYDKGRAENPRGFVQYNALLRSVHRGLVGL